MRRHRFLFLLPALILTLSTIGDSSADNRAAPRERISPAPVAAPRVSDVWVVVNLFTGRSSKQAVRVRDTLAGLEAGGRGIVLPFSAVTVENMERIRPAFLALSPNGIPWCRYKGRNGVAMANFLKALRFVVEEMQVPVIGICGGHQALALAFNGKVGPIRGGEDDCLPYGDNPTERGRQYVTVVEDDPIFLGMGKRLNMVQNHYDEVKRLPRGFLCLAANKTCPYQIIRHPRLPAYGVQAHCEYYFASRPDGGHLLRNFLNIARTHNRLVRMAAESPPPRRSVSQGGPVKSPKKTW